MIRTTVTIVIPVHNTPTDKIIRCLKSIPGTDDRISVKLYDDKSDSTDYLNEICDLIKTDESLEYLNLDRHQFMILSENLKLGGVRNKSIDDCTTDYIYFLDSDDEVIPQNFVKLLDELDSHNHELLYTDGINQRVDVFSSRIILRSADSSIENDIFMCKIPYFVTSTLYKVEFLRTERIKFDTTGRRFEDIPFTMNVWTKCNNMNLQSSGAYSVSPIYLGICEPTYIYHLEGQSLTRQQNFEDLMNDKLYWINWIEENFDTKNDSVKDRLKYESITALDYYLKSTNVDQRVRRLTDYHKCYKNQ